MSAYLPPAHTGLDLLYADDSLLVLDKPAGLLSVPGRGEDKQDCLSARAQAQFADAQIVHRLDMATSGILLMARGVAMQRALSIAFQSRTVEKRYIAVVEGLLLDDAGSIELPVGADWPNRPRQKVDPLAGKPSQTLWQVVSRDAATQTTRLELTPVTGRTHQLRVHLQAIGHPIRGDQLYAPAQACGGSTRLLLHASALTLPHPLSGAALAFNCPAPF
jgi:tRNA pseudouridine32 synthase / 23S rRNA pseudouridine746 synthase